MQGFLGEVSDKINLNQEEIEAKFSTMSKAISAQKATITGLEAKMNELVQLSKNVKV